MSTNGTGAVSQVVGEAIRRSISHNEIVTLTSGGRDCPFDAPQLEAELELESEDSVTDRGVRVAEFWGTDCDGATWRVHVVR